MLQGVALFFILLHTDGYKVETQGDITRQARGSQVWDTRKKRTILNKTPSASTGINLIEEERRNSFEHPNRTLLV